MTDEFILIVWTKVDNQLLWYSGQKKLKDTSRMKEQKSDLIKTFISSRPDKQGVLWMQANYVYILQITVPCVN